MRKDSCKSPGLGSIISLACLGALFAGSASAQVFTETSDASALLANALVVPAGTTQIDGELVNTATNEDVDTYRIVVPSDGDFTIEAIADVNGDPDMNLLVFNEIGQALAGDDDDNDNCTVITSLNSLDSCLTLSLTAGTYFISVGDNNIGAFESVAEYEAGNDFMDNDSGILASPSTEIAVLAGRETGPDPTQREGGYVINFSSALAGPSAATAIPASPLWVLALLAGLLTLTAYQRYRQGAARAAR